MSKQLKVLPNHHTHLSSQDEKKVKKNLWNHFCLTRSIVNETKPHSSYL